MPGCQTGLVNWGCSAIGPPPVWVTWALGTTWSGRDLLLDEARRLTPPPAADLRLTSSCPECGSSTHGAPLILSQSGRPVPHVSLSRAAGFAVVALTWAGPVGVDVQRLGDADFNGFDEVALHASERAHGPFERTVTWVRKESLLKAAGRGLATDMRSVRLGGPRLPPELLSWGQEGGAARSGVWMFDVLDAPAGYAVSVAVLSAECPRLVTRRAAAAGPSAPTRP